MSDRHTDSLSGEKAVEQLVVRYNELFGSLYEYNYRLMEESEDQENEGKYPFESIFDFYITSNAQSLCKSLLLGCLGSPGMLLNARCILEGLAIKRKFENGEIPESRVALLQKQVFLIEYKYYSRFDDIAEIILIPEKLEADYGQACEEYRKLLSREFADKDIKKILRSQIPFLCDPGINFRKLIGESLGEDYAVMYGVLSQGVHPSTNTFYREQNTIVYLLKVLDMVYDEYENLPATSVTLFSHLARCHSSDATRRIVELTKEECRMLADIAEVFEKEIGHNFVSDTLRTAERLLWDMTVDGSLALVEQVKSKWKVMLELLAGFDHAYFQRMLSLGEDSFRLMEAHRNIQLARNYGNEVDLTDAYDLYKTLYPRGCDRATFDKGFTSLLGYTVDGEGKTKNLTEMVRILLETIPKEGMHDRVMYLDYVESQMLSHANGYMWFANTGAWQDKNPVLIASECLIWSTVQHIYDIYMIAQKLGNKQPKPILNVLRNRLKASDPVVKEKIKLLQLPEILI
jgi:hypothetical protein